MNITAWCRISWRGGIIVMLSEFLASTLHKTADFHVFVFPLSDSHHPKRQLLPWVIYRPKSQPTDRPTVGVNLLDSTTLQCCTLQNSRKKFMCTKQPYLSIVKHWKFFNQNLFNHVWITNHEKRLTEKIHSKRK